MSMTREEAYELIRLGIEMAEPNPEVYRAYYALADKHNTGKYIDSLRTALSILAPSPRKEPPTVEEVGDEEECWYCILDSWQLDTGQRVREFWAPNEGERWLPLSALPKGDV